MGQCWQSIDLSWPGLLATILITISLILIGTSFGTTQWGVGTDDRNNDPVDIVMGLTEYCTDGVRCQTYEDNEFDGISNNLGLVTRTRAMMAMMSVSLIINLVSIIHVGFAVGRKGNAELIRFVAIECCVTGVLLFVSMLLWVVIMQDINDLERRGETAGDTTPLNVDFGTSFALEVSAMVLNVFSGLLMFMESRSIVYSSLSNVNSGGAGMI